jgi:hypothetical protein
MSRRIASALMGLAFIVGIGASHLSFTPQPTEPQLFGEPCAKVCPVCGSEHRICVHLTPTTCECG